MKHLSRSSPTSTTSLVAEPYDLDLGYNADLIENCFKLAWEQPLAHRVYTLMGLMWGFQHSIIPDELPPQRAAYDQAQFLWQLSLILMSTTAPQHEAPF